MGKPILYMIRHGEKDQDSNGKDINGLSVAGKKRADALDFVFGGKSDDRYKIRKVIAQHPKSDGGEERPHDTVMPSVTSLKEKHKIETDFSIKSIDHMGAVDSIKAYDGPGNILLCWEHHNLTGILISLGVKNPPFYPDEYYDVIWTLEHPYDKMEPDTYEHCPGIPDDHIGQLSGPPYKHSKSDSKKSAESVQ